MANFPAELFVVAALTLALALKPLTLTLAPFTLALALASVLFTWAFTFEVKVHFVEPVIRSSKYVG
jgi:hypothetical protein